METFLTSLLYCCYLNLILGLILELEKQLQTKDLAPEQDFLTRHTFMETQQVVSSRKRIFFYFMHLAKIDFFFF